MKALKIVVWLLATGCLAASPESPVDTAPDLSTPPTWAAEKMGQPPAILSLSSDPSVESPRILRRDDPMMAPEARSPRFLENLRRTTPAASTDSWVGRSTSLGKPALIASAASI